VPTSWAKSSARRGNRDKLLDLAAWQCSCEDHHGELCCRHTKQPVRVSPFAERKASQGHHLSLGSFMFRRCSLIVVFLAAVPVYGAPLEFQITFDGKAYAKDFSGRVLVLLSKR